jgi:hypothetical protein
MGRRQFLRHPDGKTAIVGVGFSWEAFIFGPLWALVKRQWFLFMLLILLLVPINLALDFVEQAKNTVAMIAGLVLLLGYMFVCGLYGNRWQKYSLERKGYIDAGEI